MFTDACLDPRDLDERLGDTGRRYPSSFEVVVEVCSDLARKRAELLETLFAKMPLREVESLYIHADAVHTMPTAGVTALVWNLPNVTAMTVRDIGGCGGIRRMLMTPPQDHFLADASTPSSLKDDDDDTPWKRAFALPRLRRLVHEASEFDESFIDAGTKRNGCVALLQVLFERYLSGHALEYLLVEGMKDKLHSVPMPTLGVLNWIREDVLTCLERTGQPTDWLDDEERPSSVNYGPSISFPEHWFLPNDRIDMEAIYALATTSTAWMDACMA